MERKCHPMPAIPNDYDRLYPVNSYYLVPADDNPRFLDYQRAFDDAAHRHHGSTHHHQRTAHLNILVLDALYSTSADNDAASVNAIVLGALNDLEQLDPPTDDANYRTAVSFILQRRRDLLDRAGTPRVAR